MWYTKPFNLYKKGSELFVKNSNLASKISKRTIKDDPLPWEILHPLPKQSDKIVYVSRDQRWSVKYGLLLFPIACFGLGTWQTHRKKWKEFLIQEMKEKTKQTPCSLPENLQEAEFMEYEHVKIRGTFDHSREQVIVNRSLVDEDNPYAALNPFTSGGSFVITPFRLTDRPNVEVLVQRGWVKRAKRDPKERTEGQIKGEVELTGVIRLAEKGNRYVKKLTPDANEWSWRDVEGMALSLGCAPIYIEADKEATVPGGPIGGQTRIKLKNDHLEYMITWYCLGLITLFMWYGRFYRVQPESISALNRYRKKVPDTLKSNAS